MKTNRVLSFLLAVAVSLSLLSSCTSVVPLPDASSTETGSENTSSITEGGETEAEEIPPAPDDTPALPDGPAFSLNLYNHPTAIKDEYIYVLKEEAPVGLNQEFTLIRSNPVTKKNGIFMEFEYTFASNNDPRYFKGISFAGKDNRYLLVDAEKREDRFVIDTKEKKTYSESEFKEAFSCEIQWQTDNVSAQIYRFVDVSKTPVVDENGVFEVWRGTHIEYGSSAHLNLNDYINHTGDSMLMVFKKENVFSLIKYSYSDGAVTLMGTYAEYEGERRTRFT